MPKTYLSDADRALARFRRWYWETKRSRDMTDELIARKLGVSQQAVNRKMHGAKISLEDALLIMREMQATDEEILRLMKL